MNDDQFKILQRLIIDLGRSVEQIELRLRRIEEDTKAWRQTSDRAAMHLDEMERVDVDPELAKLLGLAHD